MTVRRRRSDSSRSRRFRQRMREEARQDTVRQLKVETLEDRRMLASGLELISVQPNGDELLHNGDVRHTAPTELTFRFVGNQSIDPNTLDGIQLTRAGLDGALGDPNDVVIQPGFKGLGGASNEVILRFAESLPDDLYQIDITGDGAGALMNDQGEPFNNGTNLQLQFQLDLGAQVIAVVPQPISRDASGLVQRADQLDVYFNNDDLDPSDAVNPALYKLIYTSDTANNQDDTTFLPTSVSYDAVADRATLTFADTISNLVNGGTGGTFRLRIGTDEARPPVPLSVSPGTDVGSSFFGAFDLGSLTTQSQLVSSAIDAQPFVLDFPGANDEPGHREIPEETASGYDNHINPLFGADSTPGVTTVLYNFQSNYGQDLQGQTLVNLITERQKQRAREAMEMWSRFIGVQFLETADQGMTLVTGDPRALDPFASDVVNHALNKPEIDANFIVRVDPNYQDSLLILDNAHQWNDDFGGEWFETTMRGVGFMLGMERASDLPASNLMAFGSNFAFPGATPSEPIFPGNQDILHGSFLHRPDSNDIDMYRFEIPTGQQGRFTAEIFAERQPDASLLDSYLTLYRENTDGSRTVVARNDNYYSEDSFLELRLGEGVYFLGVTASGNEAYNPEFDNTGFGGKSQGQYDLRVAFRADVEGVHVLSDATGTSFDGDADGRPGGVYDFWFRSRDLSRTIIVDKVSTGPELGAKATFTNIEDALAAAVPGDIVRIVGNGGSDGDLDTLADNFAYEIGFGSLPGQQLADGTTLNVPQGVTVMVDGGTIFKLSRARVGVGSSSLGVDRSAGALQILGTPDSTVHFTSYFDETTGFDTLPPTTTPKSGDWGGIVYRNDLDNAEERFNYEKEGIFLNYVNHADMRYGGGNVVIDSINQIVTPIQATEARPTISNNQISSSADAPISADPNSFEETNFHAPQFQLKGAFTSDYRRVGPDIHDNLLVENSTNGLFIRISTPAGDSSKQLTVPGRFDDNDVVHILAENLVVHGAPGEPILELARPPVNVVTAAAQNGGAMEPGTYRYKIVFVDSNGFEGRPSEATSAVTLAGSQGSVALNNLPSATGDFVARRLYRSTAGVAGPYVFVAQINVSDPTFVDSSSIADLDPANLLQRDVPTVKGTSVTAMPGSGSAGLAAGSYNYRITYTRPDGTEGPSSDPTQTVSLALAGEIQLTNLTAAPAPEFDRIRIYRSASDGAGPYSLAGEIPAATTSFLDDGTTSIEQLGPESFGVVRARTDARLAIDPGIIVKLEGSRIETSFGSQLIAEGLQGREIIFTSRSDDRFGAGGTFDTNGDGATVAPARGDWGGIFAGHLSNTSIDHALLTFGGGVTKIEGTFKAFNVLEVHQADVRLTNSVLEENADGTAGQGPVDRFGRGFNEPATIYVRGAQPIIANNIIQHNDDVAISINANSFTSTLLPDVGRSTGPIDPVGQFPGNTGPLIRDNRLIDNALNAIDIRGEVLTTQSIWDDTDIVHVLRGEQIIVPDFHSNVGLRLQSSPSASLVVKMEGPGDNFNPYLGAGFTATGRELDIDDRIGGSLQIVGQSDFPVVLTSLADDTIGAGLTPDGDLLNDTNNDGIATLPRAGDWRSVRLEPLANDRNVELILESEAPSARAPGENADSTTAQFVGDLAPFEMGGDDNLRLGFEVNGVLNDPKDIDVYSFKGTAGTEVWLDIDRTTSTLNSVVELIDATNQVVARSDDSLAESQNPSLLFHSGAIADTDVNPLQKVDQAFQPVHASGLAKDHYSLNTLDAGMRIVLPGVVGTRSTYHVRVRSAGADINDINGGLTTGSYMLQMRLQEMDEVPGVTVRYADIRYATNGVEAYGLPGHSPLLGEAGEDEVVGGPDNNNVFPNPLGPPAQPATGPQDLGNLLASDRAALSIAGALRDQNDIDLYEFQVKYEATASGGVNHAPVVFDLDYADGLTRPNTNLTIFDAWGRPVLFADNSNISDDRPAPLSVNGDMADLSRGSVGSLDPYIGPIALPEGTYFAAVSSDGWIPDEILNNPNVQLQPIDSLRMVADEKIQPNPGGTAPVVDLIDGNSILNPGDPRNDWEITDSPGGTPGLGLTPLFTDSSGNAARAHETEPNHTLPTAQDLELELWTTGFEANIEQSTAFPHVTIVDGTGDGTRDYYGFDVDEPNSAGVFDIDIDWDEILDPTAFPMNADLRLWSESGRLLATSLDAGLDPGSPLPTDPMIQFTFATPGRYFIEVTRTTFFPFQPPGDGDNYVLHVSIENHVDEGEAPPGQDLALHFGNPDLQILEGITFASNTQPIEIFSDTPRYGVTTGSTVTVVNVQGNTAANGTWSSIFTAPGSFQLSGRNGNGNYTIGAPDIDFWSYTGVGIDGNSRGRVLSNAFSLEGYSPEDQPKLYIRYMLDVSPLPDTHLFNIYLRHGGQRTLIAEKDVELQNIADWRQLRLDLGQFAGESGLELEFEFIANTPVTWTEYNGVFIDDIIVGFAERGQMINFADSVPTMSPDPTASGTGTLFGEYQLEIRRASEYGTSQRPVPGDPVSLKLNNTFDTNDRLVEQLVLKARPGSTLVDGDTFTLSDGNQSLTFEFDSDNTVAPGNVSVAFQPTDEDVDIATSIRDAINSASSQSILDVTAGLSEGTNSGANIYRTNKVNLYGNAIVNGSSVVTLVHDSHGDANRFRDQGQLLVHSNFVTDARDFGIIATGGDRDKEPGVTVGFLEPHAGVARNLRELNNAPAGGLAPGALIENNVIAGEGLGGIHVGGNFAPIEIVPPPDFPVLSGQQVCDGQTLTVHAYRTTVTFEFEDISGGGLPCGSARRGGNGWRDGNVPIFYRQSANNWLYPPRSVPPHAYTQAEMAATIRDAIQSSILVTNGTTMHVDARVYDSRWQRDPITGAPLQATYLDHVTSVTTPRAIADRRVPVSTAAQPFHRVLNNTVFGNDGLRPFFPGTATDESNDTMGQAIETHQGRQHHPLTYTDSAAIGDGIEFPNDPSLDVDFYRFQLEIGERVTLDTDTQPGAPLDTVIRLFDAAGNSIDLNDNGSAPNETPSTDSFLDFTATKAGTYYVAVSGKGNESYDPLSLGNRVGPASSGDYDIEINVIAPRTWVITAQDGTQVADGTTFDVSDINRTVTYEFDDDGAITAGNIAIPYDSSPIGNAQRGPGYRAPEMAVTMAGIIGRGLDGVTAIALGGVAGASGALPPRPPAIDGDTSWWGVVGYGHDTPETPTVQATSELYVVVAGASNISGNILLQPGPNENVDQLLPETGILVSEQSSPTLLNNALTNLNAGIWQDASPTTVVGATIYQHNDRADSNVGSSNDDFNISLGNSDPFFVNAANNEFYPAEHATTIDSAVDSIEERAPFASVKNAVGIPVSPILAPDLDAVGLLRSDDPSVDTPSGQGANVFKDRGALDRADFAGPDAVLVTPRDNDALGVDLDPTVTVVQLAPGLYDNFSIQLVDGLQASQSGEGVGVDDLTIASNKVTLTADGVLLQEGVDYSFRYNATTNTVLLTPLSGLWDNEKAYVITLPNEDRFVVVMPNGGDVVDGETFTVTDETSGTVTFEFESGYSLLVPETLTLQVPEIGRGVGGVQDGQRLTINLGFFQSVTFEYDENTPPNFLPNNVPINISSASTQEEITQITVDTVNNAGIGVTLRNLGNGQIHVGAAANVSVDTSLTPITQSGQPGVVRDGQSLLITDGTVAKVYEFDGDGFVFPGRIPILASVDNTQDEIAQAIADAIGPSGIGLTPTNFGGGHVHLGGDVQHGIDLSSAPSLGLTGLPGVRTSTRLQVPPQAAGVGGIQDGQSFTIDDGQGNVERFEFDNDGNVSAGSRTILFTLTSTVDQLANAVISAITLAPLGLAPEYLGSGEIALHDTIQHKTDVLQSALKKSGVPGGVVTIEFLPDASFSAEQFAPLILDAIAGSQLTGVDMTFRGGATYFVDGVKTISGLQNFFIGAIKDLAGNRLQPNQSTNETKFTILMPGVDLDFGDSPAQYPTRFADNGARHVVPATPLMLGQTITSEADGQPGGGALGDSDDGVVFGSILNRYLTTPITVTASDRGLLDAWIDFNGDGDWSDPGEQIFANQPLLPGDNLLSTGTPALAAIGTTYARFRLSTLGGLQPTGVAVDGEVEDYAVEIVPGMPPKAEDDSGPNTNEDASLTIAAAFLLANDTDNDTAHGNLSILDFDSTSVQGATLTMDLNGDLLYNPTSAAALQALNGGESVSDTFTYQITDGVLPSNFATVTVVVTGLNDAPVANDDDLYATDEDTQLAIVAPGVLQNDTDADQGDSITVDSFDAGTSLGATVTMNADGSFVYDPTGSASLQALGVGESTQDSFTYSVVDTHGATSGRATVRVTVGGVNDGPQAVDDAYVANEDAVLDVPVATGLLDNDTDVDTNDVLTVAGSDSASALGATVAVNSDGSFTYDPTGVSVLGDLPVGQSLVDTFDYTVTDPHGATSTATVTVTVEGRNDGPVANDDNYATDQDQVLNVNPAGVLGNDTDRDTGDVLTVASFDAVSDKGAVVSVNSDGSFSYDPTGAPDLQAIQPGVTQDDTFLYTISDGNGGTAFATVTVTVTGVNAAPVAVDDAYTVDEDSQLNVAAPGVIGNDFDPDGQNITVVSADTTSALGATVVVNSDGSFSYDPTSVAAIQAMNVGASMADTFGYTITDDFAQAPRTDTGLVTITVTGLNDAPVAEDDSALVLRNGSATVDLAGNDHDIDDAIDPASIQITSGPSNGTVNVQSDGTVLYTPNANYSGADSLTYTIRDLSGGISNEATVSLNVNAPPVAVNDDSVQTFLNAPITINVLDNDTDVDGTLVLDSVAIGTQPSHGSLIVNADGTVVYTPSRDFVGNDSFTYTVRDDDGVVSNEATVSVAVIIDPFPWQNPANALDVNADGFVTPIDALIIINDLNFSGPRTLPNPPLPPLVPPPFLDTSGDNQVGPIDALLVINFLNSGSGGEGEGGHGFQMLAGPTGVNGALVAGDLLSSFDSAPITDSPSQELPFDRQASGQPSLPTGSASDDQLASVDAHFADLDLDHAVNQIADDVQQSSSGELAEDLAIGELLFGKWRNG